MGNVLGDKSMDNGEPDDHEDKVEEKVDVYYDAVESVNWNDERLRLKESLNRRNTQIRVLRKKLYRRDQEIDNLEMKLREAKKKLNEVYEASERKLRIVEDKLNWWERKERFEQQRQQIVIADREKRGQEEKEIKFRVQIEEAERQRVKRELQCKRKYDEEFAAFMLRKRKKCEGWK